MRASMLAIAPVLVFGLAACNRTPEPSSGEAASPAASGSAPQTEVVTPATTAPTAIVYDCGDLQVTGSFGPDKVDLSFADGRALTLSRVPSGSGARYADDRGNQFFGKGPEAILTRPGEADRICAASEIGPPTAASTVLSPTFRAQGNEPGWMTEVQLGERPSIHVEVDYGNRKFEVAEATEDPTGWAGTAPDGTEVHLRFERGDCQDDMSGERFEATAVLNVGGKEYRGCGRFKGGGAPP